MTIQVWATGSLWKKVNHPNIVFHQPVPPCKMLGEIYRSLGSRENWEHLSAPDQRLLRGIQHVALECFRICYFHNIRYGDFLKWWYPTTIGFPAKSDHFGVFWGYHLLRKHPQVQGVFGQLLAIPYGRPNGPVLTIENYIQIHPNTEYIQT